MSKKNFFCQLNTLMQFPSEGIFSKVLVKTETMNCTLMCLAQGTDIDTHTSTKQGCVQVLQGRGQFNLNGQKIALTPGILIYMPANAPHSLQASENLAFLLYLSQ
jgi:quercetin dioxygenase-like cupin family protein